MLHIWYVIAKCLLVRMYCTCIAIGNVIAVATGKILEGQIFHQLLATVWGLNLVVARCIFKDNKIKICTYLILDG